MEYYLKLVISDRCHKWRWREDRALNCSNQYCTFDKFRRRIIGFTCAVPEIRSKILARTSRRIGGVCNDETPNWITKLAIIVDWQATFPGGESFWTGGLNFFIRTLEKSTKSGLGISFADYWSHWSWVESKDLKKMIRRIEWTKSWTRHCMAVTSTQLASGHRLLWKGKVVSDSMVVWIACSDAYFEWRWWTCIWSNLCLYKIKNNFVFAILNTWEISSL
jgi:hypothetical protein